MGPTIMKRGAARRGRLVCGARRQSGVAHSVTRRPGAAPGWSWVSDLGCNPQYRETTAIIMERGLEGCLFTAVGAGWASR